ncbi:MAG: methyltransferase domain-containing protein [Methanomicrobiales archaeon]|jgi:ubiquinone/menaquinone biosynthesis C-methylase UbiE|nr:methyltransferase domain-containing protein [Methanomicrobiales archaeon]
MTPVEAKVQQHYNSVAAEYDHRYHHQRRGRCYYSHISDTILACLPRGGHLLDIGCGTGLFIDRYLASGGTATGIDISPGMVAKAQHRCRESTCSVGTAEHIPFKGDSFDAVASLLAFSYVSNPHKMLQEAYRVLSPGGSLAICTLGRNILTYGLPAIYTMGEVMRIRHVGMGDFDERYYKEDEMYSLLTSAGFKDVQARRCSFAHLNLIWPFYSVAKWMEPFVEEKLPYLAYNICARGTKPGRH